MLAFQCKNKYSCNQEIIDRNLSNLCRKFRQRFVDLRSFEFFLTVFRHFRHFLTVSMHFWSQIRTESIIPLRSMFNCSVSTLTSGREHCRCLSCKAFRAFHGFWSAGIALEKLSRKLGDSTRYSRPLTLSDFCGRYSNSRRRGFYALGWVRTAMVGLENHQF